MCGHCKDWGLAKKTIFLADFCYYVNTIEKKGKIKWGNITPFSDVMCGSRKLVLQNQSFVYCERFSLLPDGAGARCAIQ